MHMRCTNLRAGKLRGLKVQLPQLTSSEELCGVITGVVV